MTTTIQNQTLWQIGKPGGRGKEFVKAGGWQAEFTYTVGSDADSINQPNMPPVLVVPERKQKPNLYSTNKLNIRFTLEREYRKDELKLFYDFFGSEKDTLLVNGQKLTEILGAGEGKLKQNQIPLPALGKGEHTLTFTTTGGGPDKLHWIDYLKLEEKATVNEAPIKEGPAGSDIQGTDFEILPQQDAPSSRIKRLMLRCACAIDALQVEYENLATQPPQIYQSPSYGGNGGGYAEFRIYSGDYLTKISGTWGKQSPKDPYEDIVSLQFHTSQGASSRIFGGENPNKEVESFEFTAPEGYEIIGFFGSVGSRNILARLGVYLQAIESSNEPVEVSTKPVTVNPQPVEVSTKPLPINPQPVEVSTKPLPINPQPGEVSTKPLYVNPQPVLSFDGIEDYIQVNYQPALNSAQFTISFWAKVTGGQGAYRCPIASRMDNPGLSGYLIYATPDNNWQFWIGNGGTSWVTLVGTQIELNTWTHIGATYDGSAMHFYINGKEVGNPVTTNFVPNTTCPLFLGAGDTQANPNYFFPGELSQVSLWNVALSVSQIQATMSAQLQGNETGLVGYWSLTQSSGSIAYDHASGQCHGNIIGAANWVTAPDLVVAGAGGSGATSTQTQNQTQILWQIGKPGGRGKEFVKAGGWQPEFTYIVGSDADSINRPHMPPVLVVPERKQKPNLYSTNKLNIRFTLERSYGNGELTLFYDFFGSEKDTILINGQKLTEILGAGEAKLKQNQIPLPALGKGEHTLTFTTAGGGPDKLHWIDYLKLEAVTTVTQAMMQLGPAGSDIQGTDFEIKPREDAPQSRIKRLMLRCNSAIDSLQVEYENLATKPPSLYESIKAGGNGGTYKEWSINSGEYLTKISGTWGSQGGANDPYEDIISLQFHTQKGTSSPIFGGEYPLKKVEPFEFVAPEGYEIIGFFGAVGSRNILVRLGVYLQPIVAITQPGEGADSLLPTGSQGTSTQSGTQTLWQIGKPGDRADEFPTGKGFVPEFTYTIGSDADSINHPNMPPVLVVPGSVPNPKRYSTCKLNVSFNLERDYGKDELTLFYDFFGSETDTILIDGQNLAQIKGTGEGKIKKNQIPLPALVKGNHILTFTTAGGTRKGAWKDAHLIDYLKLQVATTSGMVAQPTPTPSSQGVQPVGASNKPIDTIATSETLWQIGKPGGDGKEFVGTGGWQAEFTYTVGSDADSINQAHMPPVLVSGERKQKPGLYSTDKLNISFTLERDYGIGELTLFYNFFGSETDTIFINGQKLIEIEGVGEGKLKQNQIPLPALASGNHTLTFTTSGGASDRAHWIDYLKLEGVVKAQTLWQIGKPGNRADEFPTGKGFVQEFTYTIGSDADSINHPNMPPVLVTTGSVPNPKRYSTCKLNISFNLERDYGKDELTLLYDFFGSETDTILIDGQNLTQIKGTGEGKIKKNQIPLPALVKGNHILTFTTAGGTRKGAWKDAHLIDYLKLEVVTSVTQGMMTQGPVGSDIEATDFEIKPRQDAPQSRIKRLMLRCAGAIDSLQVEYENLATQPPSLYQSLKAGGNGGAYKEWSINNGDYITKISGTCGSRGPSYPNLNIVSLQFHTHKGLTSQIFGGENPRKQVEPFEFVAPEGYQIIGFFGASDTGILVRLGVYLQPIVSITQPGEGADSLLPTGSQGTSTQSETQTLWQIGKPGDRADEFPTGKGFVPEFTYTIGSDADSINQPNMPAVLVIGGTEPNPKRYSTYKLNVSFNLERDYGKDELTLFYDFFGSETDTILIDGQNLTQIKGSGEGKIKKNQIPLPALVKGNHIFTFTTAGGTHKGQWKDAHLIDYLKLEVATTSGMVAQPAPTASSQGVTKPVYVNPQPVLSFDGIQDYIQVNYQPALNPPQFTISFWAKVTGGQGTYRCPIASRMDNPGLSGYLIYATPDNNWQFWIGNGGNSWVTLVGTQVELNTWTHIGATYDGSAMHFYINGTEVGNPVTTNFVPNTNCPLFIGAGDTQANPNYFFGGELSQVSLWNVALSVSQIQATMSAQLQGNEAGLVGYWSLTQSSGSIAIDHTSGQCHGTVIGGANWVTAPDLVVAGAGSSGATSTQTQTLWQIGKPGNRADEFPTGKGFVPEFTYTVGSDADSINNPNMPAVLVIGGTEPNPKRYSTYKLNVSFNLERDYGKDELTLFYDFFGSETDTILIDGQNLTQIKGAGEGKINKNQIPLPALVKGNHILTFTTAGGTHKGQWKDAHLIDYLKLEAVATTTQQVQGVTKPLYVGSGTAAPGSAGSQVPAADPLDGKAPAVIGAGQSPSNKQPVQVTNHIPSAGPTTSAATGLEDYAYWLKTIAKEQAAKSGQEKKPFRRGRVWT
jgi:cyanobactin cluster PatC/TenC/TruC protein